MCKILNSIIDEKKYLNRKNFHPHKFVLLLSIIELYEINSFQENKFYIDDLVKRFNRIFCEITKKPLPNYQLIELPFYHLQSDGFWFLQIKNGKYGKYNDIIKNKSSRFTKKRINDVFEYAYFSDEVHNTFKDCKTRRLVVEKIKKICRLCMPAEQGDEEVSDNDQAYREQNIISYLNSLQRSNGGNENALAEFQIQNDFFARIAAKHPLEEIIANDLRKGSHCIILTGHAGDGKTTLAFAIYRRLCNIAVGESCAELRNSRIEFTIDGSNKALLIKDLSEQNSANHDKLMKDLLDSGTRSLLVSNTGALREFFLSQVRDISQKIDVESRLLSCLKQEQDDTFELNGRKFKIYNLALRDNTPLAEQVLVNILSEDLWSQCASCRHADKCPVFFNRQFLVNENSPAKQRLFLAYRRLQAYGVRLTMRQLTEHLAYCLTGGLDAKQLCHAESISNDIASRDYHIYNLFFGGPHALPGSNVSDMASIRAIHEQQLGMFPLPCVDKKLWHVVPPRDDKKEVTLATNFGIMQCAIPVFEELLREGCNTQTPLQSSEARLQARRLLYFCIECIDKQENLTENLLQTFLQSPGVVLYEKLRNSTQIDSKIRRKIRSYLFHVLQEHFTGISLPAGYQQNSSEKLYITLNRPTQQLRQSVQMVICSVSWEENFELQLNQHAGKPYLVLAGRRNLKDLTPLELTIPFLDYVQRRYNGELTNLQRATFSQQLDTLKAQIIRCMRDGEEPNTMRLLRYCSDYKLVLDEYIISDNTMEVTRNVH